MERSAGAGAPASSGEGPVNVSPVSRCQVAPSSRVTYRSTLPRPEAPILSTVYLIVTRLVFTYSRPGTGPRWVGAGGVTGGTPSAGLCAPVAATTPLFIPDPVVDAPLDGDKTVEGEVIGGGASESVPVRTGSRLMPTDRVGKG